MAHKMSASQLSHPVQVLTASIAAFCLLSLPAAHAVPGSRSETGPLIEETFYSNPFLLGPGEVLKKWEQIKFPTGHVGLRSINAELVDEDFNAVPLDEAYLHHWTIRPFREGEPDPYLLPSKETVLGDSLLGLDTAKFVGPRGVPFARESPLGKLSENDDPAAWNSNCESGLLKDIGAWFGVGSETRHTNTSFPAPYAVEIGNPAKEKQVWKAQIHTIDTRQTVDPWGCFECLCDLYDHHGVDEFGVKLRDDYQGGFLCCYTNKTCVVKATKAAAEAPKKKRYLKYTLQYVPFDECVVPVRMYFLDVAGCAGEYSVPSCTPHHTVASCVHKKGRKMIFPEGGQVVFVEGHLHYGGIGISLRRENGDMICDSLPQFGRGSSSEVGNEAGYVTGMGVCFFPHRQAPLQSNESVYAEAVYDRLGGHTGVMGQFVVGVAVDGDYTPPPDGVCLGVEGLQGKAMAALSQGNEGGLTSLQKYAGILLGALMIVVGVAFYAISILLEKPSRVDSSFTRIPSSA